MINAIKKITKEYNIDLYSAVEFNNLRIINRRKIENLGFFPETVIVFLFPYYSEDTSTGNISAYSMPRDYHIFAREFFSSLSKEISNKCNFACFCDSSPINERDAAVKAGLGEIGDNQLLLNDTYGSYVFIGELITDVKYEILSALNLGGVKDICMHCGLCKTNCPTGHLNDNSVACLSEITQKKKELTNKEINYIKSIDIVWGCDECQKCCPINKNAKKPILIFLKMILFLI